MWFKLTKVWIIFYEVYVVHWKRWKLLYAIEKQVVFVQFKKKKLSPPPQTLNNLIM